MLKTLSYLSLFLKVQFPTMACQAQETCYPSFHTSSWASPPSLSVFWSQWTSPLLWVHQCPSCLLSLHSPFWPPRIFQLDSGMVTTFLSLKPQLTSKFLRWHFPDHSVESQSIHHALFYFLDHTHAYQDFSGLSYLSFIYNKLPPKECHSYDHHCIPCV